MLGRAFVDDPLLKAIVPSTPDANVRAGRIGALISA